MVYLVLGLGELHFCLMKGSKIAQGFRFEAIGDRPRLFPSVGAVMGGECFDPLHHLPRMGCACCDLDSDSVSSHGANN